MNGDGTDDRYIGKTLRSASLVAAFVVFAVFSYGQGWALLPYLAGFGLSVVLLVSMEAFIRRVLTPQRLSPESGEIGKEQRQRQGTAWFVGFAVIKYPLIGLLFWYLVRIWDTRHLMVFAGGILTLHLVIGLRAVGRALTQSEKK